MLCYWREGEKKWFYGMTTLPECFFLSLWLNQHRAQEFSCHFKKYFWFYPLKKNTTLSSSFQPSCLSMSSTHSFRSARRTIKMQITRSFFGSCKTYWTILAHRLCSDKHKTKNQVTSPIFFLSIWSALTHSNPMPHFEFHSNILKTKRWLRTQITCTLTRKAPIWIPSLT